MNVKPQHGKTFWNKKNILFLSLTLILVACIGVTTAWLTGNDGSVKYGFQGAFVDCEVEEDFTQGSTVKSNVRVKNTGNVNAYFRATYTVNWVKDGTENSDNPMVYNQSPKEGTDYTVTMGSWHFPGDGYWYWINTHTNPNEYSENFIHSLTDLGTAPKGYHLQVTVLAEALQAYATDENPNADEPAFYGTWDKTWEASQSYPTKAQ